MSEEVPGGPWYHGSDKELTVLRVGSSITQDRELARVFSHRPTLLSRSDASVRHNGVAPGFLYVVSEDLGPDDLVRHPHPSNVGDWEWLVTREVAVRFIQKTLPQEHEKFTEEEIILIKKKQAELRVQSFASDQPVLPERLT